MMRFDVNNKAKRKSKRVLTFHFRGGANAASVEVEDRW